MGKSRVRRSLFAFGICLALVAGTWSQAAAVERRPGGGAPADVVSGPGSAESESGMAATRVHVDSRAQLAGLVENAPLPRAESRWAAAVAANDLEDAPNSVARRCSEAGRVEVCLRRHQVPTGTSSTAADGQRPPAIGQVVPAGSDAQLLAGASTTTLDNLGEVCEGTGSDGFRVQPVYAHLGETPDPGAIERIEDAILDVDASLAGSAWRTGGYRDVRWVTDSGVGGCRIVLSTTQITSGATDYTSLMADLESQGVVAPVGSGTVKYLVWTEGEIFQPEEPGGERPATCGLGESYPDETPLNIDFPNLNLYGTRAAVDDRCWERVDNGSVPLHELTHTLGAVQEGAPNYANDGHCNDEYDLLCYGPGMRFVCSASGASLLDCNNDDYFNTDPIVGQYLCTHWNTSDSLYLQGWDLAQAPRAVRNLSVTASPGRIRVQHSGTASCYGADFYRIAVQGVGTFDRTSLVTDINVPAGTRTVTVTPHSPYGDFFGASSSRSVTVPNQVPVGKMVLSLTDGRGYGMLGYAIDPDTGGPVRMRVTIPGVVTRESNWNYRWADMPSYTGWNRTEALLFLAQLPPGTHQVCFDARDANTGTWTRLDCRTHTVK